MSIATVPGATDLCLCGHSGLCHDSTSQICRFQKDPSMPCGCQSFGYTGAITNRSPIVGNAPPLFGNRNL